MASVSSSSYEGRYFKFTVTQVDESTTVSWKFEVLGGSSLYYSTSPISCKIGSKVVYSSGEVSYSTSKFPAAKGSKSGTYNLGSYDSVTITLSGRPYYSSAGTAKTATLSLTKPTYTITYDANGGTGAPDSQTKNYGTALTLSATVPTRESTEEGNIITHYVFKGWSTSVDGTAAYQPNGSFTTEANTTLYAVWEAVIEMISTSKPSALVLSRTHDTARIELIKPEYENGATFGYWVVDTTSGRYNVSGDILTVKWDKNESVLAYIKAVDSNGYESEAIEIVCNVRKSGFCVYDKGRWKKVSPYIYRDGEYKRLNSAVYDESTGTWLKYYYRGTEVTYLTDASGDFLTDESGNVLKI